MATQVLSAKALTETPESIGFLALSRIIVFFRLSRLGSRRGDSAMPEVARLRLQEARIAAMDATARRRKRVLIVVLGALVGRWTDPMPGPAVSTHEIVQSIGRRLSRSWSERDLTAIATRATALLDRLQPGERAALGRGYLRLHGDRPVLVDVAVPTGSVPFWLGDRGFRETGRELVNPDTTWRLYRRTFDRGCIELGVNGLDRTPVAHYVVFIRPIGQDPANGDQPVVTLDGGQEARWRLAVARPGVSAAFDAWKPFETLPEELNGSVMLQASHDRRHSALLATGRVWKTHVVSRPQPDQVAIAFGADAARELVWTWRTSPDVETTALRIVRVPPARAG